MTSHATPPGERDLPAGRFAHIKGIVMDEVARTHAPRRAQRRRTVSILAAGLLLAMAVGAGAYVLRPADQFASLGCYSTAARDADVAVVSTDGRDPEDVCAELWASGEVGPTTQVPPLTSCVGEGAGAIWVLPGGGRLRATRPAAPFQRGSGPRCAQRAGTSRCAHRPPRR